MSNFKTKQVSLQKKLLEDLIGVELGITENTSEFKKVFDLCWKKLPNNTYPSVNSHEIRRTLSGLYRKFNVSSQQALAREVEDKVNDCFRLGAELDDEMNRDEKEIEYSVLHFLLAISNNPVNVKYVEEAVEIEESVTEDIDWYDILCKDFEDEGSLSGDDFDDNDDISFTDSDEEEDISKYQHTTHRERGVVSTPPEMIPLEVPTYEEICRNMMVQYWKHGTSEIGPISFVPDSTTNLVQPSLIVMSELQIMREIIAMLEGAPNSFLFSCSEGEVELRQDITTPALSNGALYSTLNYFHEHIIKVQRLHCFCDDVLETVQQDSHHFASRTFRAFSCAIVMYLQKLSEALIEIEDKVIAQKEIVTLVALQFATEEHFKTTTVLFEMLNMILDQTVLHQCNSCVYVTALLNILFETVQLFEGLDGAKHTNRVLQTILVCTIEPLLSSYHAWYTYGDPQLYTGEIHLQIKYEVSPDSPHFWEKGLILKERRMDLSKQIPALILPLEDAIHKAGKAIHLINHLGKLSEPKSHLYKDFIREYFHKELHVYPETPRVKTEPNYEKLRLFDPLLVSSFHDLISRFQEHHRRMDNDVFNEVWENIDNCHIIPSLKVEHLVRGLLEKRCSEVRLSLLEVLNTHYHLAEHMATLRRVYLMEAGLDLSQFTSEVYTSLQKESITKDWTIVFRECVSPCTRFAKLFKAECDVFEDDPAEDEVTKRKFRNFTELQRIAVSYNCTYPISVVIDSSVISSYHKIFKLLLQINYAAWSLFPLSLNSYRSLCPVNVSSEVYQFLFELTSVIKVIKTYVMEYVLNTTCLQMEEELKHVVDLDEFMAVHKKHLDIMESRCLLTETYTTMYYLIRTLLQTAVNFRGIWEMGDFKTKEYHKLRTNANNSLKLIRNSLAKYSATTTAPKPHLEWLEIALSPWN